MKTTTRTAREIWLDDVRVAKSLRKTEDKIGDSAIVFTYGANPHEGIVVHVGRHRVVVAVQGRYDVARREHHGSLSRLQLVEVVSDLSTAMERSA